MERYSGHLWAGRSFWCALVAQDIRQRAELARGMAPVALHGCCLLPDGGVAVCGAEGTVMIIDPTDLDGGRSSYCY